VSQQYSAPLTPQLIKDQFEQRSGFALEMRTLQALKAESFDCQHGLLYVDPVTDRDRQFDLRAVAYRKRCCIRLAVECKGVREGNPLVFGRLPRSPEESRHQVLVSSANDLDPGPAVKAPIYEKHAKAETLFGKESLYLPDQPVAKTYLHYSTGNSKDPDEIHVRWMQAVASSSDLLVSAHDEYTRMEIDECATFILPMVVVPEGSLWVIDYASSGEPLGDPRQENRVEFAIFKSVSGPKLYGEDYLLSHLEFVTEKGLHSRIQFLLSPEGLRAVFPRSYLADGAHS
jgi:hypothetical protein